jgi:hypothetical protein
VTIKKVVYTRRYYDESEPQQITLGQTKHLLAADYKDVDAALEMLHQRGQLRTRYAMLTADTHSEEAA